jgi:hypothetical protein
MDGLAIPMFDSRGNNFNQILVISPSKSELLDPLKTKGLLQKKNEILTVILLEQAYFAEM